MIEIKDSKEINLIEYENVDYHSFIKHKFIEFYLIDIWLEKVGFKKKDKLPPSLQIYDIYASHGMCCCPEAKQSEIEDYIWEGSALIAAKCLSKYPKLKKLYPDKYRLFLNSWNPKEKECKIQYENLKSYIDTQYPEVKPFTEIVSLEAKDAVNFAISSPKFQKDFPTVWILDPYAPRQLPWEIIQKIAEQEGEYKMKNGHTRRPEMIIIFMSSFLTRFQEKDPESVSIALGMEENEWRPIIEEYSKKYGNTREALLRLYFKRFADYYENEPVAYVVRDTSERVIVYFTILLSDHDAGKFSMSSKIKDMKKWEEEWWSQKAKRITANRSRIRKGNSSLFDFK